MKVLRCITLLAVSVVWIGGGLVSLHVIPTQKFESLPQWIQITLAVCYALSCVLIVYGFIDMYREIRRTRQRDETESNSSPSAEQENSDKTQVESDQ